MWCFVTLDLGLAGDGVLSLLAQVGCIDFGSECVGCPVKSCCYCLLPDFLANHVVKTGFAVAETRSAVVPGRETFTIKFETL